MNSFLIVNVVPYYKKTHPFCSPGSALSLASYLFICDCGRDCDGYCIFLCTAYHKTYLALNKIRQTNNRHLQINSKSQYFANAAEYQVPSRQILRQFVTEATKGVVFIKKNKNKNKKNLCFMLFTSSQGSEHKTQAEC